MVKIEINPPPKGPQEARRELVQGVVMLTVILVGLGYGLWTDWRAPWLWACGGGFTLFSYASLWAQREKIPNLAVDSELALILSLVTATSIVTGVGGYGALMLARDIGLWAVGSTPIVLGAVVLIFGLVAYGFRQYASVLYGLSEGAVGVWLGSQKLENAHLTDLLKGDFSFALAALTAGVYLVVRGCDNIERGWRDPKRLDQVVLRARRWIAQRLASAESESS